MQVSVNILKEWFSIFNEKYFNGELPEPSLAVGNSRTRLGSMSWKTRKRLFSKSADNYTIRISNRFDMPEANFKSVLLHEMIHLFIVSKNIKDSSAHGNEFKRKMNSINADGWDITISARMDSGTISERVPAGRPRIILAAVTSNGQHILSVVSPRYVSTLDRVLTTSRDIRSHSWYISDDTYFASFPTVRSPKGRIVAPQFFADMTAKMKKLPPFNRQEHQ